MARRSDGSVVAWGDNVYGQCNVPALPPGSPTSRSRRALGHTVARRSDGSVVAWGDNGYGQCNVPALPAGLTYVEVAAGDAHTVARRSDGSVVAWGDNDSGQCNVPALPPGLSYVEVSASLYGTVARYEPTRPSLSCTQPFGPATGVLVSTSILVPGHEHHSVFSLDLCPGGPGTGRWGGLCFNDVDDLLAQLQLPLGTGPFHFIATAPGMAFGPFILPPGFTFDALCGNATGGIVLSPPIRFTVQ